MKFKFHFSLIAGVLSLATAATVNAQHDYTHCITHSMSDEFLANNPEAQKRVAELEAFTKEFVMNSAKTAYRTQADSPIFTIPVVVHIVHEGGSENISDDKVRGAIELMTRDYQRLNADTSQVDSRFKGIIGNPRLQFKLAGIDPQGNCTNGITRTFSELTRDGRQHTEIAQVVGEWDTKKYVNIYVVRAIDGAGAFSFLPGSGPSRIVCSYVQFGKVGNNFGERTMTHEMGHFLNLPHTWGGTNTPGLPENCSDDDGVDDTPNTIGVANQSCNKDMASCVGDPVPVTNVENYMDYASCARMFTVGQALRMRAALHSTVGNRRGLWQESNLAATGTRDIDTPQVCTPIADFYTTTLVGCNGDKYSFAFNQMVTNASPVNYEWTFEGGTPAASTLPNPTVYYEQPGKYDVKLKASNSVGADSITKNDLIEVLDNTGTVFPPITQDFEADDFPVNSGWVIVNPTGTRKWERTTDAAYTGIASFYIRNFQGNPAGSVDAFVTPPLNFTKAGSASKLFLRFRVAHARRNTSTSDKLAVGISKDCGQNYQFKYQKSSTLLKTVSNNVSVNYVPQNQSDWRKDSVDISSFKGAANVLIKFENTSDAGNNIYIDDIELTGDFSSGINDFIADNLNLNVAPNPFDNSAAVNFFLTGNSKVKVQVLDLLGREVSTLVNGEMKFGDHSIELSEQNSGIREAGIYFVKLNVNGREFSKKIVYNK